MPTTVDPEPKRLPADLDDLRPDVKTRVEAVLADLTGQGRDPSVFEVRRLAERGAWLKRHGRSKAGATSHHVGEPGEVRAVDIISKSRGWSDMDFFRALQAAAHRHGLISGGDWGWDWAHVEAEAAPPSTQAASAATTATGPTP